MAREHVSKPTPAPSLADLVNDYVAHQMAQGLSRKTVANYELALRRILLPWMARRGIEDIEGLSSRELDRLSMELLAQGGARGRLSRASVWTYVRNIKLFLSWAAKEWEVVTGEATLPRLSRPLVETLEREEIQRIEDAAETERDKLVVRVLADTGIRVGELIGLRLQDLVEQNKKRYLQVRGKGSQERLVALHPTLARRLRRYLDRKRPQEASTDRMWVGLRRDRRTGRYEALSESGVQQIVRELGHKAGISKRVHPHVFRHSAATFMLRRGMNPLLVAKVLGHESLAMITRTYSHLTVDDVHEGLMAALREDA